MYGEIWVNYSLQSPVIVWKHQNNENLSLEKFTQMLIPVTATASFSANSFPQFKQIIH